MSREALIAEEQVILSSPQTLVTGASSRTKVKSKASQISYKVIKRSFDILVGLIGCLLTPPLAIFVKLAYMLSGDFGPIFFIQNRIGLHGREFRFFKFRTMVEDADLKLIELLEKEPYKSEWQKYRKLKNDPRISKVGKFLRKTSLDEFPQFWNVLKGDMSLIGNRPYLPREKDDISERAYNNLIKTKPGITGYWQVSGRSNIDFDDRIDLEEYYSKNASLGFDADIFFRTFRAVLSRDGAD